MSLPTISGDGKLVTDPKHGIAKTGTPWANCIVRFVGYRKDGDEWVEDTSFIAALAAFGDEAAQLATFAKGDSVHVEGRLRSLRLWQPARGEPRPELEITVKSVTRPERRQRDAKRPDVWAQPTGNRTPEQRSADAWPRSDVPVAAERRSGQRQTGGGEPRRESAIVTNLRDHAARRRDGHLSAGRPA